MPRALFAILLGGLAAGVLDILYAFVVFGPLSYGVSPARMLHSIAAGWMGRDAARAGGIETALIGLASHFLIATLMAAAFVIVASHVQALRKRPMIAGIGYGLILYVAMNYIIVPLSAAGGNGRAAASLAEAGDRLREAFSAVRPDIDPDFPWLIAGTLFTHIVLVGLPIALIARRFMPQQA